jgi:mRNA interferase RelE/StbE
MVDGGLSRARNARAFKTSEQFVCLGAVPSMSRNSICSGRYSDQSGRSGSRSLYAGEDSVVGTDRPSGARARSAHAHAPWAAGGNALASRRPRGPRGDDRDPRRSRARRLDPPVTRRSGRGPGDEARKSDLEDREPYEVRATPEARRHLSRLPEKVYAAVIETIFGSIATNPHRAGCLLRGEFEGPHSARRGDFRVVYEIDEAHHAVVVHRAAHRRDIYWPH